MEDYYWSSQSSSPLLLPSIHTSFDKDTDMPLQLIKEMDHPGVHHGFNMTYMFPGISIPSLVTTEGDSDSHAEGYRTVAHHLNLNHEPEVDRTVKLSSRSAIPSPVTPTESNSEPQTDTYSFMLHQSTPTGGNHQFLSVKRRMQNREAQRRFRQRKEDQQKNLKQKTVDLEEKYQELSDRLHEKSEEVCRLLREKNALKCEIQDLRKRWQMVGLLLQHPKGPQSLSSLFAADPPSLSGSSQTEPAAADESFRRLDAFLLMSNDKAALGAPLIYILAQDRQGPPHHNAGSLNLIIQVRCTYSYPTKDIEPVLANLTMSPRSQSRRIVSPRTATSSGRRCQFHQTFVLDSTNGDEYSCRCHHRKGCDGAAIHPARLAVTPHETGE